jgi:dihydropteroate synthase
MIFRARQSKFVFPRPAIVMGIVNVTPDSFSDGGRFLEPEAALDQALRLVEDGAEIIDVGGESTRPRATPVSAEEELRRVLPVLEVLQGRTSALISIDTSKPRVAREALRAGASLVNDVAANRDDPEMWRVVAEVQAGYVAMHMQGNPQTMQMNPHYGDVCREVASFFEDRLERLARSGVGAEQVILDVGIGFGKSLDHNLALLGGLGGFARLQRPLLVGVSRKSFLGKLAGTTSVAERLPAALGASCWAVLAGCQIVRTHDVKATWQALRTIESIQQRHPIQGGRPG